MANLINASGPTESSASEPWVSDYFPASTMSLMVPDLSNYRFIAVCATPSENRFVLSNIAPISLLLAGKSIEAIWNGSSSISVVVTRKSNTELTLKCSTWGGWIYLIP